ncbi:hypothetical protein [Rhizobium sp. MHM7A]|uniref:hypothetical protein n=1 Tax=Rhizobium sp. MHM7A TaxID=2583233 RepID=UPI001106D919|nr:hypothetical protein [Rhizobium sp. MHM7A]TLX17205.1 hypothetical protein FFR93_07800 [Rhizobium sp. MHM7A]
MADRTEIVLAGDVHYLEILKVLRRGENIGTIKIEVLPNSQATASLVFDEDGRERVINVHPVGADKEYEKVFEGDYTLVTINPPRGQIDEARNQEIADTLIAPYDGFVRFDANSSWDKREALTERPSLTSRDHLTVVLSKAIGYEKAAAFHAIVDDAESLKAVSDALKSFYEEVELLTALKLNNPEVPELQELDDGTDDLKAMWKFSNGSGQQIELTYRLPEKTFDARIIIPHNDATASFRNASEREIACFRDALPTEHKERIEEWDHVMFREFAPFR